MTKKQKDEPTEKEWDLLAALVLKGMIDGGLIENGKLTEKGRKALSEAETPAWKRKDAWERYFPEPK